MIKKYALVALQKTLNHTLSLDTSSSQKLASFAGRTLEIIIKPLNINFFITFNAAEIILLEHLDTPADTIIESSPIGLIKLSLLPSSKVRSLFNDDIKISGDVELGQRVKQFFDEVDIDWEGHLAQFTGDAVAYSIGSFVRKGLEFKQGLSHSMRQNMSEYLHEELRLFPPKEEVEDFFNDIHELSLHVERLSAQIKQLRARDENN